jgi:hypothetical protein
MKHSPFRAGFFVLSFVFLSVVIMVVPGLAQRPQQQAKPTGPWMNASLSPDERADLVSKR